VSNEGAVKSLFWLLTITYTPTKQERERESGNKQCRKKDSTISHITPTISTRGDVKFAGRIRQQLIIIVRFSSVANHKKINRENKDGGGKNDAKA
jgi:hypothetical protein